MNQKEIERLLPGIFQRTLRKDSPLNLFLEVMEDLHRPAEAVLAGLDSSIDPRRAEDKFVRYLACWVDLDRIFEPEADGAALSTRTPISTGLGRLRELTAAAWWLSKWRGTARGLQRFLLTATGESNFEIRENVDSEGRPRLFHVTVYAPGPMLPHRGLIERIIQSEKPAYVTSELVFRVDADAGRTRVNR